jgi:hypothetical protein
MYQEGACGIQQHGQLCSVGKTKNIKQTVLILGIVTSCTNIQTNLQEQ